MRFTAPKYRSAKVRHHASILEARAATVRGAGEKLKPDAYREKHGKCPRGFQFDRKAGKCVPKGGTPTDQPEDAPDQDLDQPEEAPKKKRKLTPEQKALKQKLKEKQQKKQAPQKEKEQQQREAKKESQKLMRDLRRKDLPVAEKNKLLTQLSGKNWNAYRQEVDRMRESGELPDEETAEMMVTIKGFDDLPDDVKNDKEKLREVLTQQQGQREHEKRVIQKQMKYLKDFDDKNELAVERGDKPEPLNIIQMMTKINQDLGRELATMPEEVAKALKGDEDLLLRSLVRTAPKPGSRGSKLKKWFEKITQPLPDLSPVWDRLGARSSFEGDVMSKQRRVKAVRRTQALLDTVADTLEQRGALKLSRLVDAEASGLPEADKLPDGEKAKKWDEDWTQKTADYREDLGYPPYDKVRPGVKGDDAAD